MQPMLNIALRAARLASEQIQRAQDKIDVIRFEKSEVAQLIEDTAKEAEGTITYTLQKAFPNHSIQAEFSGEKKALGPTLEATWHISVIDNLNNLTLGLPQVAICLAAIIKGKTEHAIIINPSTGEEFTASKGYGAALNGRRIRVSDRRDLENSIISTDFSDISGDKEKLEKHLSITAKIHENRSVLLNSSSSALNFANVAAGKVDGCYASNLQQATVLSSALLIQEAGGLSGDLAGGANFKKSLSLVTGNAKIFKSLVQIINQ